MGKKTPKTNLLSNEFILGQLHRHVQYRQPFTFMPLKQRFTNKISAKRNKNKTSTLITLTLPSKYKPSVGPIARVKEERYTWIPPVFR